MLTMVRRLHGTHEPDPLPTATHGKGLVKLTYRTVDADSAMGQDGQQLKDVEEEITIPPEITRLGKEAVAAYKMALTEGKTKIPYCGMLILGDSGVGKTSLYRQLVGYSFLKDLDATIGIVNNTIDIVVDESSTAVEKKSGNSWHEKDESTDGETFAKAVGEKMRKRMPKKVEERQKYDFPSEAKLLQVIKEIKESLEPQIDISALRASLRVPSDPVVQFSIDSLFHDVHPPSIPSQKIKSATAQITHSITLEKPKEFFENPKLKPTPGVPIKPKKDVDLPIIPFQPDKPVLLDEPCQLPPNIPASESARKEEPRWQRELHVSRRDSSIIAGVAKGRTKHNRLILITRDCAGQPEYRPMHHCFVTRRACYLVVFKLTDMINFIATCEDPQSTTNAWEELIYWVHSINAHIYSPHEEQKQEMKKYRRIILVGTHKSEVTREDLNKIDEFIKQKIDNDMRCANNVSTIENKAASSTPESEQTPNYFIAVENSIDIVKRGVEYLSESGTKKVQQEIERMSSTFSFLKEDYPIKWLKFIKRIEIAATSTPVLTFQSLKEMAKKSQISVEDQQNQSIMFLHYFGKIIRLNNLPHLFLSHGEQEELKGIVVIRPQWLISLMTRIFNISDYHGIDNTLVVKLKKSGVADLVLLEESFKDLLKEQDVMSLRQLCLLLKAYCLIFPLNKKLEDEIGIPSSNERAGQDDLREYGETNTRKDFKYFLVPNMLPKEFCKKFDRIPEKNWSTFYFNFKGFLPAEVYHRLLCKLLTEAGSDSENFLSRNECIIDAEEMAWRVRWKEFDHALEVSVVGIESLEKEMDKLHNDLTDICCDSRLEGLTYVGGVAGIDCTLCNKTLYYVKFSKGKKAHKAECQNCKGVNKEDQKLSKISIKENPFVVEPILPGFTSESHISVKYKGRKKSVNWKGYGLELLFEEDQSGDKREYPIHIFTGSSPYSRYPAQIEPVSQVYHIYCPRTFKTSVTIRIQHNEKEDFQNLCFMTCTDEQPPYDYRIIDGGNFNSEYGELVVSGFSLYTIGRLLTRYRVRGALSLLEKSYEASVYLCSASSSLYHIYVSIVKNCAIFNKCVKNYIKEEYTENVKLVTRRVVRFNREDKTVVIVISCETNSPDNVYLEEAECISLRKTDINAYVDSCPPHLKFLLNFVRGCTMKVKFTLEGLETPNTFILSHSHLTAGQISSARTSNLADCLDTKETAFTMRNLELLGNDSEQQLRLIETVSSKWDKASSLLGLRDSQVRVIKEDNIARGVEACCRCVFQQWLYDHNATYNYDKNWHGMCKLLIDLELAEVARTLQEMVF